MDTRYRLTHRLLKILAIFCLASLILNVWGLYPLSSLVAAGKHSVWAAIKFIWLPASPVLLVWLLTAIFAFRHWKPIMILPLIFGYYIGRNCLLNINNITGTTGFDYWLSIMTSWIALFTVIFNFLILLFWPYEWRKFK